MKDSLKKHLSYYLLQQKTAFVHIPRLILCILCFALLFAGFSFAGSRLLYSSDSQIKKVNIALVSEDDNPMVELALKYVNKLDSVNSICKFNITDRESAYKKLENKEVYAVVILPANFIDNILSGINTPAEIILQENAGADIILFETLANAAAYALKTAQAGIYAGIDIIDEYEIKGYRWQIVNDLNELYIKLALHRALLFDEDTVSATDELSLITYYGASAAVLLLIISCTGCSSFCKNNTLRMHLLIKRHGVGSFAQATLQCLALSICYFVIFVIPFLLFEFLYLKGAATTVLLKALPSFFILIFSICSFSLFLFRIAKTPQTGILLLFTLSIIMIFFSGGILPTPFLPSSVRNIGRFLPCFQWLRTAFCLALCEINAMPVILSLGFAAIFLLLNYFFSRLENR